MQQECLLQEKEAIEQESNKLQDFLAHENQKGVCVLDLYATGGLSTV